jgi:hypothetical protein
MEIISYVLQGELAHKDTLGNVKGIPPGDVQRMSAGHRRAAQRVQPRAGPDTTHFLQIWIEPNVTGIAPATSKRLCRRRKARRLRLVASPDGAEGLGHDPCRCALRAGLFDGAERPAGAGPRAQGLCAPGARRAAGQWPATVAGDAALLENETRLTLAMARTPRCWCLTWP